MGVICTELAKEAGLAIDRFPTTAEELRRAEDAVEYELKKLSLEEQETLLFDSHGLSVAQNEDFELVKSSLEALQLEIKRIPQKEAYDHAVFLNETYPTNPQFQLLFLRAHAFNANAAARSLVDHFEMKQRLFGDDVLARDIRQSDLSKKDMDYLIAGYCQVLPERDIHGRAVIAIDTSFQDEWDTSQVGRSIFYTAMAFLRDEGIQRHGTTWVVQNMQNIQVDFKTSRSIQQVDSTVPLRTVAGHYCGSSLIAKIVFAGFRLFDRRDRLRYNGHFGSWESVMFKLQTYGIPVDLLPVDEHGTRSTHHHLQWVEAMRLYELNAEESSNALHLVLIPRRNDVLFGRSKKAKTSPGTLRAHNLVDAFLPSYETKSKYEKTAIANQIIDEIHLSGGRFLKRDEKRGVWEEANHAIALAKVAHWFRHLRAKSRIGGQTQDQPFESSAGDPSLRSRIRLSSQNDDGTAVELLQPAKKRNNCNSIVKTLL